MNRKETKLLVENWRKVLEEGLYDSDLEILLEANFLQNLGKKLGDKTMKAVTTLTALAALSAGGGINQADAYPTTPNHTAAYETVLEDLSKHFKEPAEKIENKYSGVVEQIAADKTLETLYYMQDAAMKKGALERAKLLADIFEELKGKIETSESGRKYVPMPVFDQLCKKYPKIMKVAAKAAADTKMGGLVTKTAGAKFIYNTSFQ